MAWGSSIYRGEGVVVLFYTAIESWYYFHISLCGASGYIILLLGLILLFLSLNRASCIVIYYIGGLVVL